MKTAAAFIFGLVCLWIGGFVHYAAALDRAITADMPDGDAIVVLTGGEGRLNAGLNLLRDGRGARLLISGVHEDTGPAAIERLVPEHAAWIECCVDLDYAARDTVGNAQEAARWAAENGYQSLIIVTSSYHMPRSLAELRAAAPDTQFLPFTVVPDRLRAGGWWYRPGALRLLAGEYSKYLASLLRLRMVGGA